MNERHSLNNTEEMRCSLCQKEGHRRNNKAFHPPEQEPAPSPKTFIQARLTIPEQGFKMKSGVYRPENRYRGSAEGYFPGMLRVKAERDFFYYTNEFIDDLFSFIYPGIKKNMIVPENSRPDNNTYYISIENHYLFGSFIIRWNHGETDYDTVKECVRKVFRNDETYEKSPLVRPFPEQLERLKKYEPRS